MFKRANNPGLLEADTLQTASHSTDLVQEERRALEVLFSVHGDNTETLLLLLEQYPDRLNLETLVSLTEKYQTNALHLIENFGADVIKIDSTYKKIFESSQNEGDSKAPWLFRYVSAEALSSIPPSDVDRVADLPFRDKFGLLMQPDSSQFLSMDPDFTIKIFERYGELATSLLTRAGNCGFNELKIYEASSRKLLRSLRAEEKATVREGYSGLLASDRVTLDELESYGRRLVSLSERYGSAIVPWFEQRGGALIKIEREGREVYEAIRDVFHREDIDEHLGKTLTSLPPELVRKYPDEVVEIAEACGEVAATVFSLIATDPNALGADRELVLNIIGFNGIHSYGPLRTFINKIPDDVKDDPELMQCIIECGGTNLNEILKNLPVDEIPAKRDDLIRMLNAYGPCMGPLLAKYGADIFSKEKELSELLLRTIEHFGELAPEFLGGVDPENWKYGDLYFARHGKAAPRIIAAYAEHYEYIETSDEFHEFRELRKIASEEFGITHVERFARFRSRIVDGEVQLELDYSLLTELIENLNPEVRKDRPVALVIYSEADYNCALESDCEQESIALLSDSYKLFIVEARNAAEIDQYVKKFGSLHGFSLTEGATKPLELLLINSHGERHGVQLSQEMRPENGRLIYSGDELTTEHRSLIEGWNPFISHTGMMGLYACKTAQGGLEGDNFAMCWHEIYPEMAIDASGQTCTFDGFVLDAESRVAAINFASVSEEKIVRIRNGIPVYLSTDVTGTHLNLFEKSTS